MLHPKPPLADEVPWSDGHTAYVWEHRILYLRLLDVTAENAPVDDIIRIVLGVDPLREPERAHKMFESHLKRARWMTEVGYRFLLETLE